MKHRCGGDLQPTKLKIKKKIGYYYQTFTVDGYKCDCCGEETISRDTAFEIDRSINQLRNLWKDWRIPSRSEATGSQKTKIFEDNNYVRA